MKTSIYVTASTLAIALMLTLFAFTPHEVNAPPATTGPTIYVDNLPYRPTVPLVNPYTYPAVTLVGQTRILYVKIARAPQENIEPSAPTDKTFAWGFTLTYDTSMFKINAIATDVTEEPASVTTYAQFLKRRMYLCDVDGSITGSPGNWYLQGFYTTSFAKGEATLGTLTVGDTILAPSPTTVPLPAEYFDPTYGPYAPDVNRQAGANYDLPYTANATQAVLQMDGVTTVTDPAYSLLAIIKLTAIAVPDASYAGSAFHLSDIILLQADTTTNYFYSHNGMTMDAYYVKLPSAPEFPLGLGIVTSLVTLIPVIYVWRTKSKRKEA